MAFACGVRYGVRSTLIPLVVATREIRTEFPVIVPNQISWCLSIRSRFPQLLRDPGIGRGSCHIHMDNPPRLQLDEEEGKERTEEKVRDVEEITGPRLCRMSAQERFPALSTRPFSTYVPHILLNRPFTHPNIQFEQFTADTFRSPKSVVRRHLFDQADRLGRESRLSRVCLGFAFPEQAEELMMPAQKRLWPDQEEGLFPGPNHPGQEHQEKSVRRPIDGSFDLSTKDDQLLS